MRLRVFFTALCLTLACGSVTAQALVAIPDLAARVIDLSGALAASDKQALEDKLAAFEQAHGSQVAILVLPSTRAEPIEDFAHRVGEAWKIGRKGVGDGLLIIVAKDDKRVRIDVARALEGAVPDLAAKRVIREAMSPEFARGNFAAGLTAGVDQLFKLIEGEKLPPPAAVPSSPRHEDNDLESWLMLGFIGVIVGGSILKALFGRGAGSLIGGGAAGVIAWTIAGSLLIAGLVGAVAMFFLLIVGGGGRGAGGGFLPVGGWSGGSSGPSGGGFFSAGGGDFSGGGASGGWGDSGGGDSGGGGD